MRILTSKRLMVPFISLVLIFGLCVSSLMAQQKFKIAGKTTAAYTVREVVEVGDIEGHSLYLLKNEGFNESTGEHKFMDGAETFWFGIADYIKGNGSHTVYTKMSLNDNVVYSKAEGKTTTTLSPEGKPVTTFEGSLTFTKGTGKYKNIQGTGTYKGKLVSSVIIVNEWEGEYFIKQ